MKSIKNAMKLANIVMEKETNNKCIECNANSRYLYDFENDKNCYKICPFYYYFDSENKYHCTETNACPNGYKYLIEPKKRCIDNCENDNIYKYPYYNKCLNVSEKESTVIETTLIETTLIETTAIIETTHKEDSTSGTTHSTDIIDTINKETSIELLYECSDDDNLIKKCSMKNDVNDTEKYNFIKINILSSYSADSLKSLSFGGEDGKLQQITTSGNEMSRLRNSGFNDIYNISIVDLGECEPLLKQQYGIAEEDSLIIIKQEKITASYNKTKLNLSICSGVNINVYVPIELSEETKKLADEME